MRPSIFILSFILLSTVNCRKQETFSLSHFKESQVIAVQPLDGYDVNEMGTAIDEISHYFDRRIVVLKSLTIPATFMDISTKQYSADSIVTLLSKLQNDTIVEIIGLTSQPIYTIKDMGFHAYYDDKIFGMGHQPGNACIISDYRFKNTKLNVFKSRFKKIIIHETGHNLGLSHCKDETCIMSPTNGYLHELDRNDGAYCIKCNLKLNR